MSAAGIRYRERVRSLGCIMARLGYEAECDRPVFALETEIHHPREGEGAAQRAPDFLAIPLCWGHHLGALGIHNLKSFYGRTKLDQLDLLAATIECLCEPEK